MKQIIFGKLPDGTQAHLYTLQNTSGMQVIFSDMGGIITNIILQKRTGESIDVVLGHSSFEGYLDDSMFLGALIGRNSNRISGAKIKIAGQVYMLEQNNGEHNLHGGSKGFANRMFDVTVLPTPNGTAAQLKATIPHLEDGFPGNLDVTISYSLTDDNTFEITYQAIGDRETVINLTNHSYFNLDGHQSGSISAHTLSMNTPFYTPNNAACMPTGEVLDVSGTVFDFTNATTFSAALKAADSQINQFGGIDHNFMLSGSGMRKVAVAQGASSGVRMEISTTLPAVQVYTANSIPQGQRGKDNATYLPHQGFCFETQLVPNAAEMPWMRSPLYKSGQQYCESTAFHFDF